MIATRPSDDIQAFLAFMDQTMGPGAKATRVGASAQDIAAYQALVRKPLPELYVGYLREFGQRDDVLMMADDTDPRLPALLKFHASEPQAAEPNIPPGAVMIGVNGLSAERALLYPLGPQAAAVPPEPQVVVSEFAEVQHVYAETFRNHLYRQAFVRGRFRDGALFSLRRNDEALLPVVRQAAEAAGFQPYWFADAFQAGLERDDAACLYIARTPGRTSIYGRFAHEAPRDALKAQLMKQFGLTDSTPARG